MIKQRDEDKYDGVVRCYYCQKRGHVRRDCPRKARHDKAGLHSVSDSSSDSDDANSDPQYKNVKKHKKDNKGKKMDAANGATQMFQG